MKFCDERIQKHLLNGGKIKKAKSDIGWDYRPIKLDGELLVFADNGDDYIITKDDLINDWEIIGPEYDWDKIIEDKVLCIFWNNYSDNYAIGHLLKVLDNTCHKFVSETYGNNQIREIHWYQCRPLNPADFNIALDLKEYEK